MSHKITIKAPGNVTVLAARHLDGTEGPVQVGSVVDQSTRSAITEVLNYVSSAYGAPVSREAFIIRVMEIFSVSHADAYGDLFWRVDETGDLKLYANVSDVFAWGGSDCEPITLDRLPELEQAYADLKEVEAEEFTAELYTARLRMTRPQGAAYPTDTHESWRQVSALYDACGPERTLGLGNPKKAYAHRAGL